MTDELKPCPFCGSTDLHLYYDNVDDRCNPFDPCVRCNGCRTIFKFFYNELGGLGDIQKAWNRRVKE